MSASVNTVDIRKFYVSTRPANHPVRLGYDPAQFNAEQLAFIEGHPIAEPGRLLGVPGGGKTTSIIARLRRMCTQDHNASFLVVTFSCEARSDFLKKADTWPGGNGDFKCKFTDETIRTIHSLAGFILQRANSKKTPNKPTTARSIDTVVFRALEQLRRETRESLVKAAPLLERVRTIHVDEAQDISDVQYNFVVTLAQLLGISLVLIGDPCQNIYGFQNGTSRYLLEHGGFTVQLVRNYRSVPCIVQALNLTRPVPMDPPKTEMIATRPLPPPGSEWDLPLALYTGSCNALLVHIVQKANAYLKANPKKTCAIIGPVRKSNHSAGTVKNLGLGSVCNILQDLQVEFCTCFSDSNLTSQQSFKIPKSQASARLHLHTVHSSKGLEYDFVILLNYQLRTYSRIPDTESLPNLRCLWFVGQSRAKDSLHMYVLDKHPVWPWFSDLVHMCPIVKVTKDAENVVHESIGGEDCVTIAKKEFRPPQMKVQFAYVADILDVPTICTEEIKHSLENLFVSRFVPYPIVVPISDDVPSASGPASAPEFFLLHNYRELCTLFGKWAEDLVTHAYRGGPSLSMRRLSVMLHTMFEVPKSLRSVCRKLLLTFEKQKHSDDKNILTWSEFESASSVTAVAAISNKREQELHQELLSLLGDRFKQIRRVQPLQDAPLQEPCVFCHFANRDQWFDKDALHAFSSSLNAKVSEGAPVSALDLFVLNLFLFQYEGERASWFGGTATTYRGNKHHRAIGDTFARYQYLATALEPYDRQIRRYAVQLPDNMRFQVPLQHPLLPTIFGIADAVHEESRTMFEFKFRSHATLTYLRKHANATAPSGTEKKGQKQEQEQEQQQEQEQEQEQEQQQEQKQDTSSLVPISAPPSKVCESPPNAQHILQVCGYAEMYITRDFCPVSRQDFDTFTLNIVEFSEFVCTYSGRPLACPRERYRFAEILCECTQLEFQNALFALDLETTGLINQQMGFIPEITEIHVEEWRTGVIPISTLVQVPDNHVYDEAFVSSLTHITRELAQTGIPRESMLDAVRILLKHCSQENCALIAHNGPAFDFFILKHHLRLAELGLKVKCQDSQHLFYSRLTDDCTTEKLGVAYTGTRKLEDMYTFLRAKINELQNVSPDEKTIAHRAEADVIMLIRIARCLFSKRPFEAHGPLIKVCELIN